MKETFVLLYKLKTRLRKLTVWKPISIYLLEKKFFRHGFNLAQREKKLIWRGFNLAIFVILRQLRQIFSAPKFIQIRYVVDKQSYICRRCLLLQGLCVPSLKATTYVCNRFNTFFCARDNKTNKASSNLNRKFWNKST